MAGNRTRVNCLEGSYAHHYTTIAAEGEIFTAKSAVYVGVRIQQGEEEGGTPRRKEKNVVGHTSTS